ncbi:MAG: sigma-70 family RNA polymerase sigma factor [Pirellulales bacterium]
MDSAFCHDFHIIVLTMTRPLSNVTRASLLVKLRDQDQAAWREFFEIYTPVILSYVQRRGLQQHDAEDVTQDALLEVTRCLRNFEYDREKGRFRDWLGLLVRRRIIAFWRKRGSNKEALSAEIERLESASDQPIVDSEWVEQFQSILLQAAMQKIQSEFESTTWQAFKSVWVDQQNPSDTAKTLSVAIEVVYNAKSRVLKRLEAEVQRISEDYPWFTQ